MMSRSLRVCLWGALCLGFTIGLALIVWMTGPRLWEEKQPDQKLTSVGSTATEGLTSAQPVSPPRYDVDVINEGFEDGGYGVANQFMATIVDPQSISELREAIRSRGRRGLIELHSRLEKLKLDSPSTPEQAREKVVLLQSLGLLNMYEGNFRAAADSFEQVIREGDVHEIGTGVQSKLKVLLGICALRRGEIENCLGCVGPSSCIFPILPEARHKKQEGSREAVRWFTAYLDDHPKDLRVIWLLNIAYMTLGEYPDRVPARYLIALDRFRSLTDIGRFKNVAPLVGLDARGPNLAGGSIFDDFNGDGRPDLFMTSLDTEHGASLFINRGDGRFEDRSSRSGLDDQAYALNVTRTDIDNDGDLDVLLLRGGWEKPARLSLLKNDGNGAFEDITIKSGLGEPIASEAAAWGDFDNDGWLDVYVCGEYLPPGGSSASAKGDPRNRGRLYRNQHDGTFVDVAPKAGVVNMRCGKGAAWGDYDGDGRLDLFVSNMGQASRLYRNEGDGRFRDVAVELGVTGTTMSFACWFWDYDNDGRLDLYVNDYRAKPAEVLAGTLGLPGKGSSRPRLYRNLGIEGFHDVTADVGLDRPMAPMGANFGDLDNDGYLDIYLGTGDMSYSGLDLNLMLRNKGGARFEDITNSAGTGHLQKGHGVSFADWNGDGALDVFVEFGGATPGDKAYNVLFENPGHGRHWLKVKLVGTRTNRAAIGAKIQVNLKNADGSTRSMYRTIGNNSSFGGNSLVESVGLLDSSRVAELLVTWPSNGTVQTFRDLRADQTVEITEGVDLMKPVIVLEVSGAKPEIKKSEGGH